MFSSTIRLSLRQPLAFRRPRSSLRRPQAPAAQGLRRLEVQASAENNGANQRDKLNYQHILLAILDSNPHLSSATKSALDVAANLVQQHNSKLTIVFVDEEGKKLDGQRISLVQGELRSFGIMDNFEFLEEEIEPSVGKGSVCVGEVADKLESDLVVLSTECIHAKHVDGNLLAEFVPCPVLLVP